MFIIEYSNKIISIKIYLLKDISIIICFTPSIIISLTSSNIICYTPSIITIIIIIIIRLVHRNKRERTQVDIEVH